MDHSDGRLITIIDYFFYTHTQANIDVEERAEYMEL